MEPFYQSWGGGEGDVEFISLSIMGFDSSVEVANYKTNHGHTFPGVGTDGGSAAARAPYTNGTYGQFLGTPTFVVIAPDRSVTYDPRSNSFTATIDLVDAAIASTGARKPFNLSGTVTNINDDPVVGVIVQMAGVGSVDTTGEDGHYTLSGFIRPDSSYQVEVTKNGAYNNGVTNFDLIKIRKQILSIENLGSPDKLLAADANRSSSVSTQDLIALNKLILTIVDSLPNQDSWIFIDADYEFAQPNSPYSEVYQTQEALPSFDLEHANTLNIRAIKIGDVNGSANLQE
ncbi:MAG: hypothetical protein DHS20C18_09700 [Saprospiraceae bacterium]|nr:MAG: hypothetical protein DHS20C18_09700 [Saprospiraceae bacterium]